MWNKHVLILLVFAGLSLPAFSATRHYQYDENGSLVRGAVELDSNGNIVEGTGLHFEYNDANRLVRVRAGGEDGVVLEEYSYDYRGQRFKKTSNLFTCGVGTGCEYAEKYDFQGKPLPRNFDKKLATTTYYVGKHYEETYKGSELVEDDKFVPADTTQTNHTFALGQRVAKDVVASNVEFDASGLATPTYSEKKLYFLNNHLGSTDVVLGANAEPVASLKYFPFGEIRNPSEESYSYTGKEKDFNTNQYYYEARYYDAGIRQFTQADSIIPELYNPQSLNRYSYVRNNATNFIDPSGHLYIPIYSELKEIEEANNNILKAQQRTNSLYANANQRQREKMAASVKQTNDLAVSSTRNTTESIIDTQNRFVDGLKTSGEILLSYTAGDMKGVAIGFASLGTQVLGASGYEVNGANLGDSLNVGVDFLGTAYGAANIVNVGKSLNEPFGIVDLMLESNLDLSNLSISIGNKMNLLLGVKGAAEIVGAGQTAHGFVNYIDLVMPTLQ